MTQDSPDGRDSSERFSERWPRSGDRIFSPGRDAFIAGHSDERSYRLLRGYKRAGDVLAQKALTDRYDRDNLVWPALFNYRHYIELALKAIVESHGPFVGISLRSKNHSLPELWSSFIEIATAFGNDCSDAAVIAVGKCIDEFATIDGRSTAFRYARSMDGQTPALPPCGVDLVTLQGTMSGIQNFFECADLDFGHKSELATPLSET